MKQIVTCILLSLFFAIGTSEAYADRHNDRGHDRKEQRDKDRRSNKKYDRKHDRHDRHDNGYKPNKKDRHNKGYGDYRPPKGHSMPAPGHGMGRPVPPPVRHYSHPPRPRHHAPVPPPPPPRLSHMVRYATRGCRDVAVWQINPDTYIVKYRRGNRYYTQYLYPYDDIYGDRSLITVNWQPLSPWTLVPPIQLNINL